jgi:hypothetical protein
MLLTALALSDDNLFAALRESQVLQRIELSIHSCKVLAAQDEAWYPAWHALRDLQQVLTVFVPVWPLLVGPYSEESVLRMWDDIGSEVSVLRGNTG